MKPPLPLNDVAQAFWDRHYDRLRESGVLTDGDVDSFAVLCLTWGKLQEVASTPPGADCWREMIQLDRLAKQYLTFARQFGLVPRDRKQAKMDTPSKKRAADEFGLG